MEAELDALLQYKLEAGPLAPSVSCCAQRAPAGQSNLIQTEHQPSGRRRLVSPQLQGHGRRPTACVSPPPDGRGKSH